MRGSELAQRKMTLTESLSRRSGLSLGQNPIYHHSLIDMPSKSTVREAFAVNPRGMTYKRLDQRIDSQWQLRPDGKPDLTAQNPHNMTHEEVMSYSMVPAYPFGPDWGPSWNNDPTSATSGGLCAILPGIIGLDWNPLEQTALAKYNGRLRAGSASLGMALASWRQSRDMIITRSSNLATRLDRTYKYLDRNATKRLSVKRAKEPLANAVLETKFGWLPLYQDLYNASRTLFSDGIPPVWITGRHTGNYNWSSQSGGQDLTVYERCSGTARVTVAAACSVSNPNLWLLNHLGLINPATIIWDAIPWSFVVGMFGNFQALLEQFTAEVGLDVKNKSTTRSFALTYDNSRMSPSGFYGTSASSLKLKYRSRHVGSHPSMQLVWRVPDFNWDLALTAVSLVMQKFAKINRLIGI